jgi:hypothetical protein
VGQVLDALGAIGAYETCSQDTPRPADAGTGGSYAESVGDEDERIELIECDATLCAPLDETLLARSAAHSENAFRGGAQPVADRGPDRCLADAGLAAAASRARSTVVPYTVPD